MVHRYGSKWDRCGKILVYQLVFLFWQFIWAYRFTITANPWSYWFATADKSKRDGCGKIPVATVLRLWLCGAITFVFDKRYSLWFVIHTFSANFWVCRISISTNLLWSYCYCYWFTISDDKSKRNERGTMHTLGMRCGCGTLLLYFTNASHSDILYFPLSANLWAYRFTTSVNLWAYWFASISIDRTK